MVYEPQSGKAKRTISQVEVSEFKGFKTISIPVGKDGEAFTFGALKAKAICKNIDAIMKFVEDSDKEYEAKKAAGQSGGQKTW